MYEGSKYERGGPSGAGRGEKKKAATSHSTIHLEIREISKFQFKSSHVKELGDAYCIPVRYMETRRH